MGILLWSFGGHFVLYAHVLGEVSCVVDAVDKSTVSNRIRIGYHVTTRIIHTPKLAGNRIHAY
jgi:hypothetical protein